MRGERTDRYPILSFHYLGEQGQTSTDDPPKMKSPLPPLSFCNKVVVRFCLVWRNRQTMEIVLDDRRQISPLSLSFSRQWLFAGGIMDVD